MTGCEHGVTGDSLDKITRLRLTTKLVLLSKEILGLRSLSLLPPFLPFSLYHIFPPSIPPFHVRNGEKVVQVTVCKTKGQYSPEHNPTGPQTLSF